MNLFPLLIALLNLDRFHTQCNAYNIYFEQIFVCRVDVQLTFKNVRRNEKVYTKYESEKIPEADSAPRVKIYFLKMELLVKIVNDCKLFLQIGPL